MPYYIYIVTAAEPGTKKSVKHVSEYENFKLAKNEVRRLRTDAELQQDQSYRIIFAADIAEAEQRLAEYREQPIAREWEK